MREKFKFRYTPERIRPYVAQGKEESAENFYRENPWRQVPRVAEAEAQLDTRSTGG